MAESSGSVVSNNLNIQKQSSAVQSTDSVDEDKTDKVMEPILLEDFEYNDEPRSLLNLIQYFEKNKLTPTKFDILVGIVYILFLETGFVPAERGENIEDFSFNYKQVLQFSKELPNNWKTGDRYNYLMFLPPFTLEVCKVVCIMAADDMILNCVVNGVEHGSFNILLDPLTYFKSSRVDIKCDQLQNLKSLSRMVKNEICYPAKQAVLRSHCIFSSSLDGLPTEILFYIMINFLDFKDFVHLERVSKLFNLIVNTPKVWRDLLFRDFKVMCDVNVLQIHCSKLEYARLIKSKQNLRKPVYLLERSLFL